MSNLVSVLEGHAARAPDQAALIHGSRRLTYGELHERVCAMSAMLARRGLEPGGRALLFVPMSLELYVVFLGVLHRGATVVFIDPGMGRAGVALAARRAKPDVLLSIPKVHWLRFLVGPLRQIPTAIAVGPSLVDGLPRVTPTPGATVGEGSPALLTFTSGTTGAPKGAVRSHAFLLAQHRALQEVLALTPADVDMPGLPVFVLNALAAGATCVIPPLGRRVADVDGAALIAAITRHGVTTLEGSPVIAAALAREAARTRTALPTVRGVYSGGAPVLPSLHTALLPWLPNGDSVVVYGSTEAEPISASSGRREVHETATASATGQGLCVGRPVASVSVRLVDDEILVAGDHVNEGYFDDPEAAARYKVTDSGGRIWHRTGDAARWDELGRLWLLGRHEHRLAVPDGWLYPTAVEVAARMRPGVAQAAVLDDDGVTLIIEPAQGELAPDLDALRALHPALRRVVVVKAIPTDPRHNAKIDYVTLRKTLARAPR